MDPIIFPN